ncbi:MAG: aldo/keto reductase [bacterium]|nr:aldo/keto reductase [bacterium]
MVQLGNTGISIFPLIFGTLPLGPLQAGLSPQEGARLIRHALEGGVTMIDTATLYGTYPHVRLALQDWHGEVTIATKTHTADPARGLAPHKFTPITGVHKPVGHRPPEKLGWRVNCRAVVRQKKENTHAS